MKTTGCVARWMVVVVLLAVSSAQAGRFEDYTGKFANGEKMAPASATFFGGAGMEEFTSAAGLADGTIVAGGNMWGPAATGAGVTVLGQGTYRKNDPWVTDRRGSKSIHLENPDRAGMLVFYAPELASVLKVIRFAPGTGSIDTMAASRDGKSLLVAGRSYDGFASLGRLAKVAKRVDAAGRGAGNSYVMQMNPNGTIDWVVFLAGHATPPSQLWPLDDGGVMFEAEGMTRIAPGAKEVTKITNSGNGGRVGLRVVNPATGAYYIGGDRNTNTGREPWRQPIFYECAAGGAKQWQIWGWDSHLVGSDKYRLVSDSAIRTGAWAANGDLFLTGWSDGGNSVYNRQPEDLDAAHGLNGLGMQAWGMKNANSLGWLFRLDPRTRKLKAMSMWLAFIPDDFQEARVRNSPNFAAIDSLCALEDGTIAFAGRTATGLIQTPGAFYKYPRDGSKFGGPFVAVVNGELNDLLFSSHLPGCEAVAIAPCKGGVVVVARSTEDGGDMGKTPTIKAVQPKFGGQTDGWILLLKSPKSNSK